MKKYLRCFNNDGLDGLTVGKCYEIVGVDTCEGGECYVIIDDVGGRDHWPIEPDYEGICYLDRFTLEIDEEPRKIDGRKAEITQPGERFGTYVDFAIKHGFPDAAHDYRKESPDIRRRPQKGDIVTLLVSGEHDSMYKGDTLWIVEAENGERHIFNEKGLRILNDVIVLKDESLGGVLREYREVKRKACEGERIKIIAEEIYDENRKGEIYTVTKAANYSSLVDTDGKWDDGSTLNLKPEEYVVLEPTDIIVIGGARYRMVDREAAVGEHVIVTNAEPGYGYKQGGVYEIKTLDCDDPCIWPDGTYKSEIYLEQQEYRVLEPVESVATPRLSALPASDQIAENITALAARVSGLEAKVAELGEAMQSVLERANPAELSMSKSEVETAIKVFSQPIPPQQLREEIVERAKADVKDLEERAQNGKFDTPATRFRGNLSVEFVVNREARTVVALLRLLYTPKHRKVYAKGIAKCAPNDVFNVHIGKAIALRRALGLEVPAEYLSVPNPEEPRVGDVVKVLKYFNVGAVGIVAEMRPTGYGDGQRGLTYVVEGKKYWSYIHAVKVIDDSRESVEEVPA